MGVILTSRTALLIDLKGAENEMAGSRNPIVDAVMAANVPRFPAAKMESRAFKMLHLMLDKLPWVTFGVCMARMIMLRGVMEEMVREVPRSKSILILCVEVSNATMLAETGFQPKVAVHDVTLEGSRCQPEPETVITSALGAL